MPYFLYDGSKTVGPFEPSDLVKRPDFNGGTLVAPAGATTADAWKPAADFPELAQALKAPPPPPPPAKTEITLVMPAPRKAEPEPAPMGRGELTVELPVKQAPAAAPPADDLVPASEKTVLVVDDDEVIRGFIELTVSMQGFKTETAANGKEALAKLAAKVPDLIITDLMMPQLGGYELLRAIQAEGGRVPIFVVSASQLDSSTIKLIQAEANVLEFVPKPVQVPVLAAALHKHLKTKPVA